MFLDCFFQIRLDGTAGIPVRPGDVIGFANVGDSGLIGYNRDHQVSDSILFSSSPNLDVPIGQQVTFYPLDAHYEFAVAVNYVPSEYLLFKGLKFSVSSCSLVRTAHAN